MRCPARSPSTRLATVTWSGVARVGPTARAIRKPRGRKKWRSIHSSTTWPLAASAFGSVTQHVLHGGKGLHRLVLSDHERRVDAHLRVVDHSEDAAGEQGVEEAARGLLIEQGAR